MNYYEVLYILNPNFSKEQIAGVMSEVNDFVEKKKHGIVNHDFWGKKQLAYNVKKHKCGNIYLCEASFTIFVCGIICLQPFVLILHTC